jgi:uncharacterized protein YkwD
LRASFALVAVLALTAACTQPPVALGPDGRPLPQVYRISAADAPKVQFRALDTINALRAAAGAPPLQLNAALNAAAAIHSRDMARQNRPWNFGSDGSSPLDRVRRAGYTGRLIGENISESYETELETIAGWMENPDTRPLLLDPRARDLGFSFYQEENGKIWWTMVVGG